ncbi:Zn-dependent oxidoreductase, NADPH:quinone reductase [Hoeflea sp. IMCC20628]|uniref:NADPH:quinone reductase n=1 Tax=Hoeflea sp. IMCC20628 TaxID=1620421 RepID=UPI00063A9F9F|nr:NADPH:quinone reductase [Hoeflea sp. IMCC20628]AKI02734.1 Zn-dependent oxidoreductase, NADPH:quinone reductase [Hoeflea sp. IMCC20628]
MKAIFCTDRGPAAETLSLLEASKPSPGPGEVLVAMKTSGVNPSDVKTRSGAQGPMVADRVMIHNDGAGIIEAVGDGVDSGRVGERIWLYNVNRSTDGVKQGTNGTAADYICVPAALAAPLPDQASFEAGACLGVPAMTAHRAVLWAGPVAGKTVLVTGGAGAVGHSAIQIAKAMGARVIATVSSDQKAAVAREAGADAIINYKTENLEARIIELAGPDGVDHVAEVDLAAHMSLYPRTLGFNATVGAYASATDVNPVLPFFPLAFRNICLQPVFVYSMSDAAKSDAIRDINALLTSGALTPMVAKVFALGEVAAAHQAVESGTLIGNAILKI